MYFPKETFRITRAELEAAKKTMERKEKLVFFNLFQGFQGVLEVNLRIPEKRRPSSRIRGSYARNRLIIAPNKFGINEVVEEMKTGLFGSKRKHIKRTIVG